MNTASMQHLPGGPRTASRAQRAADGSARGVQTVVLVHLPLDALEDRQRSAGFSLENKQVNNSKKHITEIAH